ncbi:glycoside hydrolase family 78 protein [Sphaerobolus stellatus SS14]|uniref:Glycoside hydrolase family 78 protein n=1 Tax=Sphaerobolus stellatus (strain SS14) TaxID=990650 RepID=A0A0C9UPK6_SPHS4|nr:glycoside hydrolase family 78 protein [Sphaerobolus stellatus SS14]
MGLLHAVLALALLTPPSLAVAPSGPWDAFNIAPAAKTLWPTAVKTINGTVSSSSNLVGQSNAKKSATIHGNSWIALDFGKEVGGFITLSLTPSSPNASLSLAFSESPLFIGPISDDSAMSSQNQSYDGALKLPTPLPTGQWTMPTEKLRGGFRYLTIVATGSEAVSASNISVALSFMPHWDDLRAYTGYFYAPEEELLTRAWYAGAYTVQTNTVPLHTGRQANPFVPSAEGWLNNATLGIAGPIIVDGAKRDRAVWPGDMGIAVPTQIVSTFDLIATKNALGTMFAAINPKTGALPESGPPLSQLGSDTYHSHTLIGLYTYVLHTGDLDFLRTVWDNYTLAVGYLNGRVDTTGLLNVGGTRDWARVGQGGHNVEANAIYNRVLQTASSLATILNLTSLSTAWSANVTAHQATYNTLLYVPSVGLFKDNNTDTTIYPEDGNSFAILYNLTMNNTQVQSVSEGLTKNWNNLGPVAPELPGTIAPFIAGFELQAHFLAGQDARALDLMRRTWGFMLNTPSSVQSTLLEGFLANGSISYRSDHGYTFDAAYTSHSHGWSSGATSALSFYVLGLTITSPGGATFRVEPQPGNLTTVEGGYEVNGGWFGVKWNISGKEMTVDVESPGNSTGVVLLPPGFGVGTGVVVDGKAVRKEVVQMVESKGNSKMQVVVGGGKHVVVARKG